MRAKGSYLTGVVSVALFAMFAVGCATVPPKELVQARQAYERASADRTNDRAPAEVHKAKASLDKAEVAFADEPESQKTRDLAYVAERKAQLAIAIGETRRSDQVREQAEQEYLTKQRKMAKLTRSELAETRGKLAVTERKHRAGVEALGDERAASARALGDARTARANAELMAAESAQRAKNAADALARLAAVKDEARGLVITLSGSVLFASNKSALLGSAQTRLNKVSAALLETKERDLIVEGHSDSQGSSAYNLALSQRRAESVRSYLISRGYSGDRIQATGIGEDRPVTDNGSVEGRANNRRVEIVVKPKLEAAL